jgi:hypothetical protein
MSGVMKVVKVKDTQLFNALDWKIIRNAIEMMNMVVVRATLLAKLYYLTVTHRPWARTPPTPTLHPDLIQLQDQIWSQSNHQRIQDCYSAEDMEHECW